jgi:hypothetical protein
VLTVNNLADLYDGYPALPAAEAAEAMVALEAADSATLAAVWKLAGQRSEPYSRAAFFGRLQARRRSAQSEKQRGGRPKGKARADRT